MFMVSKTLQSFDIFAQLSYNGKNMTVAAGTQTLDHLSATPLSQTYRYLQECDTCINNIGSDQIMQHETYFM